MTTLCDAEVMLQEELYSLNQGDVWRCHLSFCSIHSPRKWPCAATTSRCCFRKITSATSSVDDQWNGRDDEVTCRTQHRDDALFARFLYFSWGHTDGSNLTILETWVWLGEHIPAQKPIRNTACHCKEHAKCQKLP